MANKLRRCYKHPRGASYLQSHLSRHRGRRAYRRGQRRSLYEAVARVLAALRDADWGGQIRRGLTTITVLVKQPEVEHKVGMRDFEAWLQSNGRSPAEMALKFRLRELLSK
jgi:hypothetical protein